MPLHGQTCLPPLLKQILNLKTSSLLSKHGFNEIQSTITAPRLNLWRGNIM